MSNEIKVNEIESELKKDMDKIIQCLSELDSLNNKLKVLGVKKSHLNRTILFLEKTYGDKQKALADYLEKVTK